jgi:hypothetical protein
MIFKNNKHGDSEEQFMSKILQLDGSLYKKKMIPLTNPFDSKEE